MADKMMRIAGRTSEGTAVAMSADTNGNIGTTRKWGVDVVTLFSSDVTTTEEQRTTNIDLSEYPIVSLRITNRTGVSISVTPLVDLFDNSNGYELKDASGGSLSISVPNSGSYLMLTPNDAPWLNYLKYLRLKFSATETPTATTPRVRIDAVVRK